MTHVRTSPFYPQSNGKIERWHKSLKGECIRPRTPLSLDDARGLVQGYVDHYNNVRLNSATGTSRRRTCRWAGSKRSTRSVTGSWRRRGSNGRFVASKPLDRQYRSDRSSVGTAGKIFRARLVQRFHALVEAWFGCEGCRSGTSLAPERFDRTQARSPAARHISREKS